MIDKGICDEGFVWNPINCECECDKSCDVGKYLDYANCNHRKKLVDKLVEECTENIDDVKIAGIALFECENKCKSSCNIYSLHCDGFYDQHWRCHLFYLLQVYES